MECWFGPGPSRGLVSQADGGWAHRRRQSAPGWCVSACDWGWFVAMDQPVCPTGFLVRDLECRQLQAAARPLFWGATSGFAQVVGPGRGGGCSHGRGCGGGRDETPISRTRDSRTLRRRPSTTQVRSTRHPTRMASMDSNRSSTRPAVRAGRGSSTIPSRRTNTQNRRARCSRFVPTRRPSGRSRPPQDRSARIRRRRPVHRC